MSKILKMLTPPGVRSMSRVHFVVMLLTVFLVVTIVAVPSLPTLPFRRRRAVRKLHSEQSQGNSPTSDAHLSGVSKRVGRVVHVEQYEGVYHIPDANKDLRGLMLALHGCSHSAGDWSDRDSSNDCPTCLALPEEMHIVRAALERGYAVLALSSQNRRSKCWDAAREPDLVAKASLEFIRTYLHVPAPETFPVTALGVSSGGALAAKLPLSASSLSSSSEASGRMSLVAICTQVAHLSASAVQELRSSHPAAVAVYMESPRISVDEVLALREEHGVDAMTIQAQKLPLSPLFFSQRIQEMSPKLSHELFAAFQRSGLLDENHMLTNDPRRSDWRSVVRDRVPEVLAFDSLVADQSAISEVLNVAYCVHEITAERIETILDVFDRAVVAAAQAKQVLFP